MEVYTGNTRGDVESLNGRILGTLKSNSILKPHETQWSNIMEHISGTTYAIMIGPRYRDVIINELTEEEKNKIVILERDDPYWFPGVKNDTNTKLNL
jgi:hypothetical protein